MSSCLLKPTITGNDFVPVSYREKVGDLRSDEKRCVLILNKKRERDERRDEAHCGQKRGDGLMLI